LETLKEIAVRFKFKEVFKNLGWDLRHQANEMLSLLQISDFSMFESAYSNLVVLFKEDGVEFEAIVVWLSLCRESVEV